MSYGRIRRGPMAADAFTQIRNSFFRDPRLTFKDKGVFGLISTHQDGFGVTPESIAHFSVDGVSAVKVALRNLEKYGYLQRTRQRNTDGTLGSSVYFITDQPELLDTPGELESPRSAPEVENPPVDEPPMDEPPVAEPPVENRPHKKTNSKHTSPKKTLSPPPLGQEPQQPPAPIDEREESAARADMPTAAQRAVRSAVQLTLDEEPVFIAWITAKYEPRSPAWWRTAAEDLPELASVWRAQSVPQQRASPSLPPWCGECGDKDPAAETDPSRRFHQLADGSSKRCTCHPTHQKAA